MAMRIETSYSIHNTCNPVKYTKNSRSDLASCQLLELYSADTVVKTAFDSVAPWRPRADGGAPGRLIVAMQLTVVDVLQQGQPAHVQVDERTTLGMLKNRILSLRLPTPKAVLEGQGFLRICHDGVCIQDGGDEGSDNVTLGTLGVLSAPVVVIVLGTLNNRRRGARSPAVEAAAAPPEAVAPSAASSAARSTTHTEAAPAFSSSEPPADAVCRICFDGVSAGKLISPCLCTGSMRYVHVSCLNEWRTQSANPRSFYQCDQCQYQYNVQRTRWAEILESDRAVKAVAACLLLVATTAAALLLAPLGAARLFYRLVAFDPWRRYDSGELVSGMWCWQLDALVSGLLGVAGYGVGVAIQEAYRAHRHMTHTWAVGLFTALATSDARIFRVFALLGGAAACKSVKAHVEHVAKQMLTTWGTMILEVRRG